ncbi:hypothetical protein R1sor_002374 [Riccia sorocarpa]|uniref:Uncharacterized protein n=1 Tax=Riccia sorocarpa TaxID=122646 RepID=A0ABD3H1T2_9MARC
MKIALENSKCSTEPEGTQEGKTQAERSGTKRQPGPGSAETEGSVDEHQEDGSEEMGKQKLNELSPVTQTDLGQQVNPLEELDLEETTGQNLEQGIDTIAPEAATGQEILNVKENAREVSSAQTGGGRRPD